MSLQTQIVEDRVDQVAAQFGLGDDEAFLRFAHSLVVGASLHAFDEDDLVEGSQDKQIDIITIEEQADSADVYIIQAKNSESFSSNALIQLGNGLSWLFDKRRAEIDTLTNTAFRDKIIEFRAIRNSFGPSNLRVHVRFVTKGDAAALSHEFEQELRALRDRYEGQDIFESFELKIQGSNELVAQLNMLERRSRRIDADLKIRYDANTPSLIKYYAQDLKGLVCTLPAQEIARVVNEDATGAIFDRNIRQFLGGRKAVNRDILGTATGAEESYEFWFLNNGLTIVCDTFDAVTDPDNPHVKVRNMQIVNGCQTATTLALAQRDGTLKPDVRVLVRIYEASPSSIVDKIVLTTNNQNKISSRDLRANDAVQIDMERAFEIYGYHYERKARQFEGAGHPADRILANEVVAQWYLAVVLSNPADARARKYKVWSEHYDRIFSSGPVEPYIIATRLGKCLQAWVRGQGIRESDDETRRMIGKRGGFHLGRVCGFLLRQDRWSGPLDELQALVHDLDGECDPVSAVAQRGFDILEEMIRANSTFAEDVDKAFKSAALNEALTRKLFKLPEST